MSNVERQSNLADAVIGYGNIWLCRPYTVNDCPRKHSRSIFSDLYRLQQR